jgi:hypothetical protein
VTILSVIARKAVRHERGTGVPCWACLGAQRLGKLTLAVSVREVHIFADDDDTGRAARHGGRQTLCAQWQAATIGMTLY